MKRRIIEVHRTNHHAPPDVAGWVIVRLDVTRTPSKEAWTFRAEPARASRRTTP